MKRLFSILVIALLLSLSMMQAFAADAKVFSFPSEEYIVGNVNANAAELAFDNGALKITYTGEEHPLIWFKVESDQTFDASQYKFMKIKYKADTLDTYLRLFWGVFTNYPEHPGPNFDGAQQVDFPITLGDWTTTTIDLTTLVGNWTGQPSCLRFDFDPISAAFIEQGETFEIEYIAFFTSEADAADYDGTAAAEVENTDSQPETTAPDQTTAPEETPTETTAANTTAPDADTTTPASPQTGDALTMSAVIMVIIAAGVLTAVKKIKK